MSKATAKTKVAADSEFGKLWKDYVLKIPGVGDIIKGAIVSLDSGAVRIDVAGITTGVVRGEELQDESDQYSALNIGDEVEATVIDEENENGEMELSFRTAGHQRVWDRMMKLMTDGVSIKSKIHDANKGGLMMKIDSLSGFMPVSQLNPDHYPRVPGGDKIRILEQLRKMIGSELTVKVIDVNPAEDKLIVSEKAVWEDEQKSVLEAYKIGAIVEGEISAVTSFGAFVRFGEGLEGLVHISEIVWQRIDHPRDVLKVEDKVRAQIIDLNKSKIYLSLKRLVDDPWKSVKDRYQVGQVVDGIVHKIEPFGLMIKLDNDIHGLAHISELSNAEIHDVEELKKMFTIGQSYKFEIVNIEPAEHRLGLKVEGVKGRKKEKEEKKESPATEEIKEENKAEEKTTEEMRNEK